jgi:hypothetical protein
MAGEQRSIAFEQLLAEPVRNGIYKHAHGRLLRNADWIGAAVHSEQFVGVASGCASG